MPAGSIRWVLSLRRVGPYGERNAPVEGAGQFDCLSRVTRASQQVMTPRVMKGLCRPKALG